MPKWSTNVWEWIMFSLTGLFWGTSFFWIKIALREIDTLSLITWRVIIATLGLLVAVAIKKTTLTRDKRVWLKLFGVAFFSPFLGFACITWGETRVDSSVASILNGTVPLFAIAFSHLFIADEKMTSRKVLGLILGFFGVFLLFAKDLRFTGGILGQLSVLAGAASYAFSGILSRRLLRGHSPIEQALGVVAGTIVWCLVAFVLLGKMIAVPREPMTWLALTWLGLLGTSIAWLLYFELFNKWGVVKVAVVNYILPVVGILAGVLFLDEPAHILLLLGGIAIFSGIAVVHGKPQQDTTKKLVDNN
jgi:drug/metabolite transporter (DMT)-like permease